MKVVQINAFYEDGSTGVIVRDLHSTSLKNGIESYVVFSSSSCDVGEVVNPYVMGNLLSKKFHALLSRINGRQGYFSKNGTRKLLSYLDEIKPDIVHLHNLHANYINLNILLDYLSQKDISTVLTLHDCWFFTGGCYHFVDVNCIGYQSGCGNCPKKHTDLKSHFLDKTEDNLKDRKLYFGKINDLNVVGASNWISEEAQKSILKDKKHFAIHNGVDTDFFVNTMSDMKEQLGISGKFVVLGLAGKWLSPINKEAFDYVTENLPKDSVIVLFGCSKEQKENLPENVIGLDFISDKDMLRKLYSLADVFINSTRADTFPFINIEPQSCGTPVVTYGNAGAKETVDNVCGFFVDTDDYKSLFEKVMEIKKNGKNSYSGKCREFVLKNFDKNGNYQKYIELYKKIYEGRQK